MNIIENKKIMYLKFDTFTGELQSCSSHKTDSSIEIDALLAQKFALGVELMPRYKVIWKEGIPTLIGKNFIINSNYNNSSKENQIDNVNIYKIPHVSPVKDCILIKFLKKQKKIIFSISENFRNTLKNLVIKGDKKNHRFFSTKKNDGTILDRIFIVDLQQLISEPYVEYDYAPRFDVDIYCIKIFDYKFEVSDE